MGFERMSLLDSELRGEVMGAPPRRLRLIAVAAATLAIESVPDHPSALDAALEDLHRGRTDPKMADSVRLLADELDEHYLEMHDHETPGWMDAFRLARAAAALAYAFVPDEGTAAGEAVYEAVAALDGDKQAVLDAVRRTRSG